MAKFISGLTNVVRPVLFHRTPPLTSRPPAGPMRSMPAVAALLPLTVALVATAFASGSPAFGSVAETDPMVVTSPVLAGPALTLPDSVQTALRARDWSTAAAGLQKIDLKSLVGGQKGDLAFVLAWSLVHADRGASALGYLPLIDEASDVPPAYAALVKGEVLRATDQKLEAIAAFETIGADSGAWPRATIVRAETLRELGRTAEAYALYEAMVARPDPAGGSATALLALAKRDGLGSEGAYGHLRRAWAEYPRAEEAAEVTRLLAANYPGRGATWQEAARRGEILMGAGDYSGALAVTAPFVGKTEGDAKDACRFLLVRGRSQYRAARLSEAVLAFGDIGARCTGVDADYGPKGLYLAGQALYRRHDYAGSAKVNLSIAELYPTSSFADDGLTHAGIALLEAGDSAGAAEVWTRALRDYPAGDTVPESSLRLAYSRYTDGKPDEARKIANDLGKLPITGDWVHVAAGRYWAARWALYPDVHAPSVPVADAARRQEAVDGWASLCRDMPHSFYAILAYSRLVEVAPEVAAELAKRPADHDKGQFDDPWVVRLSFYETPAVREGVDLARLGLLREAQAEWSKLDDETFTGDEKAWLTQLRILDGDWLLAHDDGRQWLRSHPPGTLGPREAQVLRVLYPDRYWTEIQAASKGYDYEPRLFHALSREESNFNRTIQSNVGARGLSQLMPTTAREVAGWLHVPYSAEQLDDPVYNATLGARYFQAMIKQHHGSPYLSCAAYNAGGGRTKQWLTEWGNLPTDEYVEQIPFRETRGYVKRVMGTWQTMRWQFDDGPLFYDLSAFNHQAMP